MQMWLYQNKSDERYLTKNITEIPNTRQNNVYLKDRTNLIDPVIIMDDFPKQCNYVWLSEFDRYYYVRAVDFVEGQMHVQLHVDVLMSFKDEILAKEVYSERSKVHFNDYIEDDKMVLNQYTNDRYLTFSSSPFDINQATFILTLLGT